MIFLLGVYLENKDEDSVKMHTIKIILAASMGDIGLTSKSLGNTPFQQSIRGNANSIIFRKDHRKSLIANLVCWRNLSMMFLGNFT
jgi:hypothetical protein